MKKKYEGLNVAITLIADDVITDSVEVSFDWTLGDDDEAGDF